MVAGNLAKYLSGQKGRGGDSEGESAHSPILNLAVFVDDQVAVEILFLFCEGYLPEHLSNISGHPDPVLPERDQDVGELRIQVRTG